VVGMVERRSFANTAKISETKDILDYSQQHTDTGCGESPVPVIDRQRAAHERRKQGTRVYAHIEYGKSGVAPIIIPGIEIAHHLADVRFEKACTDGDKNKSCVEKGYRRECQQKMAHRYDDSTDQCCPLGADVAVGEPAAQ